MDPRLLDYYNRELRHVHETALEFARAYPKIARRLGLDGFEVKDPYVERLLDGFAYLAARVRLKVDAEFPRFSQHLLEMVYPHYLAPVPSMGVVHFVPDLKSGSLLEGYPVPRGSVLRTTMAQGDQTACEYRTADDVTLWPIRLTEAAYVDGASAIAALGLAPAPGARSAVRLAVEVAVEVPFADLALDSLVLFVSGGDQVAMTLYEQLVADPLGIAVRGDGGPAPAWRTLDRARVRPRGFDQSQALLPVEARSFQGYRLLQEYFACPTRFLFVEVAGLAAAVRGCGGRRLEVLVQTKRAAPLLARMLDAGRLSLFCTPAINLFPKRADPIPLSEQVNEYHVVADRSRPLDFEVFAVSGVRGWGAGIDSEQEFRPFYACDDQDKHPTPGAYYALHREPRLQPQRSRGSGPRSPYVGSETFVSLVDAAEAPFRSDLRQLSVATLCTNRDLPVSIATGDALSLEESGAPVTTVRFAAGPTPPRPSTAERDIAWKLISHLALNYLSLVDSDAEQGAAALRELLMLYVPADEPALRRQVEGVTAIASRPIWRRLPLSGSEPVAFGRGIEVTLTVDESAFEGSGAFLLGAVLEQFFARYASINAFTETVLCSTRRGEIMRWPARIGRRQTL